MSDQKRGLCVIGCGKFAAQFSQSIQPLLSDINLFFASRNICKSREYARRFNGTESFGSYEAAAQNVNVHALYICTPHYLHVDHVSLAINNGKHVLVEKPIATTIEGAETIISMANRSRTTLMVAENYHYLPEVRLCKELVTKGEIGEIRTIEMHEEYRDRMTNWRSNVIKNGGGIFIDSGIHKVHFLRYLLGKPKFIYATTSTYDGRSKSLEDNIIFIAKWSNGTVGLINQSWRPHSDYLQNQVTVTGSRGRIYFEAGKGTLKLETSETKSQFRISEESDGVLPMVKAFLDSIINGTLPETTGEEGLNDLTLIKAAYTSASNETIYYIP